MKLIKNFNIVYVFLLVIVSFDFFEARFLSKNISLYFQFLYIFSAVVISLPYVFQKRGGLSLPIQMIFISMLVSIFTVYVSWGQGIKDSLLATMPYMLWIFFFYLLRINFPVDKIETIIIIYGFIYCLLYFYQYTHPGNPLFGSQEEFSEDRGVVRIIFPGGGALYLASFLSINKLTTAVRQRWLWGIFSFLGLICTVLQVTRQAIFALLIIYVFHFIKDLKLIPRTLFIILTSALIFYIGTSNNRIVKGLKDAQKTSAAEGKSNIRVVAAKYFLVNFSPNNVTRVLGNGVPYALETYYALYVASLEDQGFYLSDVGIVSLYTMFGILAVAGYFIIWFYSFSLPVPKEFYYVKYYLWYLLITCLTSDYLYSMQYLITTVFALYVYQHVYTRKNGFNGDFEIIAEDFK